MRKTLLIILSFFTLASFGQEAHYRFENNATDQLGNHDGTLLGGGYSVTQKYEGSYGLNADAVDGGMDCGTINLGSEITITCWVRKWASSGTLMLFSNRANSTATGIEAYINCATGVVSVVTCNGAATTTATSNAASWTSGNWCHYAIKANRTTGVAEIRYNKSDVTSSAAIRTDFGNNQTFYIGNRGDKNADSYYYADDFQVYLCTLSDADCDYTYDTPNSLKTCAGAPTPSTQIWVDGSNGDDGNTGADSTHAVQTLGRLNTLLITADPGVDVYIANAPGGYNESIYISGKDGTSGDYNSLNTWNRYTGGNATITGYKTLGTFTGTNPNWTITESTMTATYSFPFTFVYGSSFQRFEGFFAPLLINDVAYNISKEPDIGYWEMNSLATDKLSYFYDYDNVQANDYWNGATMVMAPEQWITEKVRVTDYEYFVIPPLAAKYTLNTADWNGQWDLCGTRGKSTCNHYPTWGWYMPYYLINLRSDQSGEWAYNFSTKALSVYYAGDLNAQTVQANNQDSLLYMTSCDYWDINEINFKGGGHYALGIKYGSNIYIDSCKFEYTPQHGAVIFASSNIYARADTFKNTCGIGILFHSCTNESVLNSYFYNIGTEFPGLGGESDNEIGSFNAIASRYRLGTVNFNYNWIENAGYSGILIKGQTGYGGTVMVQGNYIQGYGDQVSDAGGFYTFGDLGNTTKIVRKNMVLSASVDCESFMYGNYTWNHGLYLDGYSNYWVLDSNYVFQAMTGVHMNGTAYNTIRVNTTDNVVQNSTSTIAWAGVLFTEGTGHNGTTTNNTRITNNKFIKATSSAAGLSRNDNDAVFSTQSNIIDTNYYTTEQDIMGEYVAKTEVNWGASTYYNLVGWRGLTGWDARSHFNLQGVTYDDVTGVTPSEFVTVFKNWTSSNHTFYLGDCTFKNYLGVSVTGSITVGPYFHEPLFFVSGTYASADDDLWLTPTGPVADKYVRTPWIGTRRVIPWLNNRRVILYKK